MSFEVATKAIIIVFISAAGSHVSAVQLIQERTSGNSTAQLFLDKLSDPGKDAWGKLTELADSLERMPTLIEYAEMLVQCDGPFTKDDRLALFFCFGIIQKPILSRDDLHDLLRAQRSLIDSLTVQYTVTYGTQTNIQSAGAVPPRYQCEFVVQGQKIMFKQVAYRNGSLGNEEVQAFDGAVLRTLLVSPGEILYGTVSNLDMRGRFYSKGNPLISSGLLNSRTDLGRDRSPYDLAFFAKDGFIYETSVAKDGVDCIIVGGIEKLFYCAPRYRYALVESNAGSYEFDKSEGRYVLSNSHVRVKNSSWANPFEQVWLPKASEYRHTVDGSVVESYSVNTDKLTINTDPPNDLFTDVFPEGSFIHDGLQAASYVLGQGTEAELRDATPLANRSRTLLFIFNVVVIIVILGIMLRRWRVARAA